MTYEQAIKELENILTQLESGQIELDQAMKLFEKSVELTKLCLEKIKTTEGQVELVKKELDSIIVAPFDDIKN